MNISNIINVQLLAEGANASLININDVMMLTTEQGDVLSSDNRYVQYRDADAPAVDFGASSKTSQFANTFFGTSPNPVSASGSLIVGYWRAAAETVAAKAATLVTGQLNEVSTLALLNAIPDGSFSMLINGVEVEVLNLDLQAVDSLDEVCDMISEAITQAALETGESAWLFNENGYLTMTNGLYSSTSTFDYPVPASSGTFIGEILGMADGSGAVITNGADEETLEPETMLEALTAIKGQINFFGAASIEPVLDAEVPQIGDWAKANSVLFYETFSKDTRYLERDMSNPVWVNTQSSNVNFRCLFSKSGNRKYAISYMARQHVVNFSGSNTTNTMNLKTLNIPSEEYSEQDISKAYAVGADIYTIIKDVPVNVCSPKNDFSDNTYNLMSFVDAVQTGNFNFLKNASTKVPQTIQGIQSIDDNTTITVRRYVTNGMVAPGEWTIPDFFGDYETFMTEIRNKGFYILSQDLADQAQSERTERIAPVQQIAIKNAGAVHRENVIINFNK